MIPAHEKRKIVIFGAGKIGRSFIGAIFSRGGYEVVFIDKDANIIKELNRRHSYQIIHKTDIGEERISIKNVRGINALEKGHIVSELVSADICAVSVGMSGILNILPILSDGLLERYKKKGLHPLDIIIAENMADGDRYILKGLREYLPKGFPAEAMTGLIETSIGKMVPIMQESDLTVDQLTIIAEPYNTLIVSKGGFKCPVPEIEGLEAKDNIKAWVDRKRFIHNLGHVAVAYPAYLYNPELKYVWEALEINAIFNFARSTMLQSARILQRRYPDEFKERSLEEHIDDLLYRFCNKALGDTLFRIGCDLRRKLGENDRLAGAIHLGNDMDLNIEKILFVLTCGTYFRANDENGQMLPDDSFFIKEYKGKLSEVLTNISGFNMKSDSKIIMLAKYYQYSIKQGKFRNLLSKLAE